MPPDGQRAAAVKLPAPRPVREWHDVDRDRFRNEIMPLGAPAVLRGLTADWPAVAAGRAGAGSIGDYLARFDRGTDCAVLIGSPRSGGRFFYGDHLGVMNFQERAAPLAAVLDRLGRAAHEELPPAIAAQALVIPDVLAGFEAENRLDLLDPAVAPRMWIGNRVIVACHYDTASNIACVVAGRRRFTLFPPDQVSNLYIGPYESTPAGAPVSLVDFDAPDFARFPGFAAALGAAQIADLAPGDALYIPYMWWHHVRSLDPVNLLVNYWWNDAPGDTPSALDSFLHALLAVRDLPMEQRAAWRAMFDAFVFRTNGDPMGHLPAEVQGVLGNVSPAQAKALRLRIAGALAPTGS
jgi:hypothetical protein